MGRDGSPSHHKTGCRFPLVDGTETIVRLGWIAVAVLFVGTVAPARAQFDPAFNHLFCYGIHELPGEVFTPVTVDVETQLGVEQDVTVMRPAILCAPAKKTGGGVDPLPPTA